MRNKSRLLPSRRRFIASSTAVVASTALAKTSCSLASSDNSSKREGIFGFSKPFAGYSPEDTADMVAEIGWDGIECPVRKHHTHIDPERVEEMLPKMAEALKKRDKKIAIVSTDITHVDPMAERILKTIASLGIKRYRFGFKHYSKDRSIEQTVKEFGAQLKDLSALNAELGLQGGYQNHSGSNYIGGPIWDLWLMMKDLDAATVGICWDIGQAMIEGGLSWPTQARLTRNLWVAVHVKDFVWKRTEKRGWQPEWCRLGEGRITEQFYENLKATRYSGPISQHHEHLKAGMPHKDLVNELKMDFEALKTRLA